MKTSPAEAAFLTIVILAATLVFSGFDLKMLSISIGLFLLYVHIFSLVPSGITSGHKRGPLQTRKTELSFQSLSGVRLPSGYNLRLFTGIPR